MRVPVSFSFSEESLAALHKFEKMCKGNNITRSQAVEAFVLRTVQNGEPASRANVRVPALGTTRTVTKREKYFNYVFRQGYEILAARDKIIERIREIKQRNAGVAVHPEHVDSKELKRLEARKESLWKKYDGLRAELIDLEYRPVVQTETRPAPVITVRKRRKTTRIADRGTYYEED